MAVEGAVANSADEIAQLRQITQALREAIESLHHEHRQEIQRLNAAAQEEAVQLQAAARALREQLEEAAFQTQVRRQEAAAAAAAARSRNSRRRAKLCAMNSIAPEAMLNDGGRPRNPCAESRTERRTARQPAAKPRGQPRLGGMRERLQDVNILLDVTRRISGTDSLDEILEALVEMTSLALSCDRCSFFLNDAGTGELYSRVAQGIRRREIRLLNNDGVIGAAFQTGRSIIIDDAYADPRFNPTIDRETGYVTKTVLCVPLCTAKGDIIGVAQALNKAGGLFHRA